jgi:hypothetical protein
LAKLDIGLPVADEPLANNPPSLADFSVLGVLAEDVAAPSAASKGFPAVFGVLAEPNDAKAPWPKPKADAPGETRPPPGVVMLLKGLLLLSCDELSPPNRLAKVVLLRPDGEASLCGLLPDVDRESLLELQIADLVSIHITA